MMLNSFQPYVRIHADGIPLLFHFDTGNVATTLYPPYYELFREQVDSCGVEDTVRIGGFAGVAENVCYRLPSVEFTLEGVPFTLRDIDVLPSGSAGAGRFAEANLFGFDGDIYGEPVAIFLLGYIRPERRFAGLDELRRQLADDRLAVIKYFNNVGL